MDRSIAFYPAKRSQKKVSPKEITYPLIGKHDQCKSISPIFLTKISDDKKISDDIPLYPHWASG
jgi:hypothetical protein